MLLWHVVDGADGDLARMTGHGVGDRRAGRRRLRLSRQRRHVFRLRLPARRHARAPGPGSLAVARRRQPCRPDQPCRDPAPRSICGGPMACPGCATPPRRATRCSGGTAGSPAISASGRSAMSGCPNRMSPSANPIDAALARRAGRPARDAAHPRAGPPRLAHARWSCRRRSAPIPRRFIIAASDRARQPALIISWRDLVALNLILHRLDPPPQTASTRRLAAALSRALSRASRKASIFSARLSQVSSPRLRKRAGAEPRGERRIAQDRSSAAAAAVGLAGRDQQRIVAVAEQFRRVGRDRARGSAGRRRDRRRASAAARNCGTARAARARAGSAARPPRAARPAASAGACQGTIRTLARAAASASIGPSPSDPTSRNRISGRSSASASELVEPLLRVDPPGIERRSKRSAGRPSAARAAALSGGGADPPRLGAVMRDQDLLLRHARAAIGAGRIIGMEDEAEAFRVARGAPDQRPDRAADRRARAGNDRWRRGEAARAPIAEHRRNARIEEVGAGQLGVAEHLPQPQQGPQQRLAGPAARPLDQAEIALDRRNSRAGRPAVSAGSPAPRGISSVTSTPRRASAAAVFTDCSRHALRSGRDHIRG